MSRVLYYIQYIIYVYVYKEINKFNKNQCEICSENITAPVFIVLYVKMQVYIVYEILKKVYMCVLVCSHTHRVQVSSNHVVQHKLSMSFR